MRAVRWTVPTLISMGSVLVLALPAQRALAQTEKATWVLSGTLGCWKPGWAARSVRVVTPHDAEWGFADSNGSYTVTGYDYPPVVRAQGRVRRSLQAGGASDRCYTTAFEIPLVAGRTNDFTVNFKAPDAMRPCR